MATAETKPKKKRGGHNKHKPDDKLRAQVSALVSFGVTHADISKYIGINTDTLTKYYRHELDTGAIHANAQVAGKLYKKAVQAEDLSAMIFWLKTRARWRTADKEDAIKGESLVEKMLEQLAKSNDE